MKFSVAFVCEVFAIVCMQRKQIFEMEMEMEMLFRNLFSRITNWSENLSIFGLPAFNNLN